MRRAVAPPEIARQPELELMRDERGPVGLAPGDRKYGHALIGGQGEARPASWPATGPSPPPTPNAPRC